MPGCWRMAIFVEGCSRADDEPAGRMGILTRLTVRCCFPCGNGFGQNPSRIVEFRVEWVRLQWKIAYDVRMFGQERIAGRIWVLVFLYLLREF